MHPSGKDYLDGGENLPLYYGGDRLVLLPRDPYWLYAYWEISLPTRPFLESAAQKNWESLDLVLRTHRFNPEKNEEESHFDIQIPPSSDNWYIKAGVPNKKYRVELGCLLPEKNFKTVLVSNVVTTPRDSLSDIIDENWRLPDWQARRLYWRIARGNLSSMEMMKRGLQQVK
ncbi:MAG: DUF4912 domain-containing protein [Dethiobacter sp.]|jgi:hypothetical protein|nr:MAG: DUF4912 domain-containing protein [Dethiobacter sp.]